MTEGRLTLRNFLDYYNDELGYLRRLGERFAAEHEDIAGDLGIGAAGTGREADPHVERVLDAFAFLAARIHLRLDDDFPGVTTALLELLYPQFCRPVPSVAMVQLEMSEGSTTSQTIPVQTPLTTVQRTGTSCTFRTCYPTLLHPITVDSATFSMPSRDAPENAGAVLKLGLRCFDKVTFRSLKPSALRFYVGSDPTAYRLYELIHNSTRQIRITDPARRSTEVLPGAPGRHVFPVGFDEDQNLWPPSAGSFRGYQILQEFFAFPQKYLFFEMQGEDFSAALAGCGDRAEIELYLGAIPAPDWRTGLNSVTASRFRLGCTPVINLFAGRPNHPVELSQAAYEYPLLAGRKMEIYSVEKVLARTKDHTEIPLERFYDLRAAHEEKAAHGFWFISRKLPPGGQKPPDPEKIDPNEKIFSKSEVVLSVVDGKGRELRSNEVLTVRLLCTNGNEPCGQDFLSADEPERGNAKARFQLDMPGGFKVHCLGKPTESFPAVVESADLWRLIAQLSLNHKSLIDEGPAPLKSLLSLHNLTANTVGSKAISGIRELKGEADFARIRHSERGPAFVRGKRIDIVLNEDEGFLNSGVYLFGAVLDQFFGVWTSLNSFTQLNVRTPKRNVAHFAPRAGNRIVA